LKKETTGKLVQNQKNLFDGRSPERFLKYFESL